MNNYPILSLSSDSYYAGYRDPHSEATYGYDEAGRRIAGEVDFGPFSAGYQYDYSAAGEIWSKVVYGSDLK